MNEVLTERSGSILKVQLNRPAKKNAITTAMYVALAEALETAAKDDATRVVLIHGAGDSFTAGNDLEDFVKNPPGPGESPQMRLFAALNGFDKPIVAAVHGVAVGFGTTMLVLVISSMRARAPGSSRRSSIWPSFPRWDRATGFPLSWVVARPPSCSCLERGSTPRARSGSAW